MSKERVDMGLRAASAALHEEDENVNVMKSSF